MRFMVMVKATRESEAGKLPSEELLAAMAKFNEDMVKAGVMLDGNGLQPSSKGARVRFSGGKRTVIDGPFTETKELVAGYWILDCRTLAEAIEWIKRSPIPMTRTARSRSGNCSSSRTSARTRRSSTTAAWPKRSGRPDRPLARVPPGWVIRERPLSTWTAISTSRRKPGARGHGARPGSELETIRRYKPCESWEC